MSTQTEVAQGERRSKRHYPLVGKCYRCRKPFHKRQAFVKHLARCGR